VSRAFFLHVSSVAFELKRIELKLIASPLSSLPRPLSLSSVRLPFVFRPPQQIRSRLPRRRRRISSSSQARSVRYVHRRGQEGGSLLVHGGFATFGDREDDLMHCPPFFFFYYCTAGRVCELSARNERGKIERSKRRWDKVERRLG